MPTKAKIAIPDDNINLSRALKILASINLIKLASNGDINYSYTLNDIEENKLNLEIVPTKVEQIRYMMYKFTAAIINYNFASDLKDCNIIYHYNWFSIDANISLIHQVLFNISYKRTIVIFLIFLFHNNIMLRTIPCTCPVFICPAE